jgi:hypothetical protein
MAALGPAFRRLAALHERDVAQMRERQEARAAGHDGTQYQAAEQRMVYSRGGQPLWSPRAELMARFLDDLGLLRWWWYGALHGTTRSRLDALVAEGQRWQVDELTRDSVQVETLEAADELCALAANLARADGVVRTQEGDVWSFYALYDAGARRAADGSVPAPPSTFPPPAALRALQSLPPPQIHEMGTASEPSRELVTPVAQEAMVVLRGAMPHGFTQALLTVNVDVANGKARFFVHLVALDAAGDLAPLDPSQRLFDAVATMIGEHRRRGGGDWRKLVLRMRATERGASIDVRVA